MTTGTSYASSCYPTQLDAARAWCSGWPAGPTSCSAVLSGASSTQGGATVFSYNLRVVNTSTGAVTNRTITGQSLNACEQYDWAYFEPIALAFLSALVAVSCAKWLFVFFWRDKEVV